MHFVTGPAGRGLRVHEILPKYLRLGDRRRKKDNKSRSWKGTQSLRGYLSGPEGGTRVLIKLK